MLTLALLLIAVGIVMYARPELFYPVMENWRAMSGRTDAALPHPQTVGAGFMAVGTAWTFVLLFLM